MGPACIRIDREACPGRVGAGDAVIIGAQERKRLRLFGCRAKPALGADCGDTVRLSVHRRRGGLRRECSKHFVFYLRSVLFHAGLVVEKLVTAR